MTRSMWITFRHWSRKYSNRMYATKFLAMMFPERHILDLLRSVGPNDGDPINFLHKQRKDFLKKGFSARGAFRQVTS